MEAKKMPQLSRESWLQETLKVLQYRGVDGVKIVVIAESLGVTSFRGEEIQKEENEDKKKQRDCKETLPAR